MVQERLDIRVGKRSSLVQSGGGHKDHVVSRSKVFGLQAMPSTAATSDQASTSKAVAKDPVVDAGVPFSTLELSDGTQKALAELGYTSMRPVQERTIPPLLTGKDVLGAARTGSGKTLAFLVPAIELVSRLKFKPRNG